VNPIIVFLLEEPSAKEMLNGLLPRLIPSHIATQCIAFQGKQDLERNIVRKMRGWKAPNTLFVVMRDQDSGDCQVIKKNLQGLCFQGNRPDALVRIACKELESWYLADLQAVEKGLGIDGLARNQNKAKFRNPDHLGSPSKELSALTNGEYQKIGGSRRIGPHLNPENQRSNSFTVFVSGLKALVDRFDQ
jgi:hypothetical protein